MTDLKELLKHGEKLSRRMLLVEGVEQLVPMFHLVAPEGGEDQVVGCSWRDPDEKYEQVARMKQLAHKMGAVAALFITEAWMSVQKPNVDLRFIDPPSQQPNREEVVMIIAIDNEGNQETANLTIVRDKPAGTIIALKQNKEAQGVYQANIIDGLLPPKKG